MQNNKNRWFSLFVLVLLPFMSTLDANIINVALPTLSKDLNIAMADVEWVVTIYLIVISSTIIIFGRIGDLKSKVLVFKGGLFLFTLGSLLCGLSHSLWFLIFSRMVQALGAACAMATNQGIITQLFPQNERGRALGISGMAVALGTMTGAPLGGLIISITSWHAIFLVNVPVGIFAFILAMRILPKEKIQHGGKFDVKGAILYFTSIALLLVTLNISQQISNTPLIVLGLVIAIALIITFILVERKTEHPLLDVNIFKNTLFSLSIFCSFLTFMAISSLNIIHPFYLQDILLLSAGATGIFMMIFPIVSSAASPVSGHMSDKIGSEILTFIGLCVVAFGLFGFSFLGQTSSLLLIGIFVVIVALGNSLFQSPNTSLVMSTVPRDKLGVAGSTNALFRNLGMTIGILTSTSILYNRMSVKLGHKVFGYIPGEQSAFMYGMHWAYGTAALICLFAAVLTGIRLRNNKKAKRDNL